MKLTIRLALLLALCAAPLRAGTFEVKPGESFGKVSAANDGDTFIIHPGAVITGNVRITGKVPTSRSSALSWRPTRTRSSSSPSGTRPAIASWT
jgi:hypothetical protein